ncbi:hypothetical protein [Acinetobacter sp. CFCC 10889]|uniref:hypothetical protein n=1 Tax=Acinetobacter sp. CFCC 10889 TaxID=1775557 RepID=UPI000DD0E390|nr:hypothetical protein [Acinetobacter sp. CFCC 10889]
MNLPARGSKLPPRETGNTDKPVEEVIKEAPLKTSAAEQTNPVQSENELKPWLVGEKLDEAELSNLTRVKSFNIDYLTLAKLEFVLNAKKAEKRGVGQKKPNETILVLEGLNKLLDSELKKMGYKP